MLGGRLGGVGARGVTGAVNFLLGENVFISLPAYFPAETPFLCKKPILVVKKLYFFNHPIVTPEY
ncbi:MAG: hypothetical protein LBD92_00460 [Oscillospiraceae bacterium]|jgi:hypothetical protein|nr:hypothetical protein [Oscillospiraceae bacterium]